MLLPSAHVNTRALHRLSGQERLLTVDEGLTEIIAVTDVPGQGRRLLTNGHPMSSTSRLSQRYMRALAHIPLLAIANPQSALVIGFGVGNTTHAATLHPSIQRVEVADLSRGILAHADYFTEVNQRVLADPRVTVYVNDGRQHLQMQPPSSYDLVTLEPPPIAYAGVAALYSREFYELVRGRLKAGGYVSQWLPAYQVPSRTSLAMIRAFIDVFPQAVLISGAEADLLLLGVNDSRIEIDPARVAAALSRAPAVAADLRRLDLGSVREIVGTFLGSSRTLHEATREATATSDDHPLQEYDVRSLLNLGEAVPASVVDLSQVASWCPQCFVDGAPVPIVDGLDTYLALLDRAYSASPSELARVRRSRRPTTACDRRQRIPRCGPPRISRRAQSARHRAGVTGFDGRGHQPIPRGAPARARFGRHTLASRCGAGGCRRSSGGARPSAPIGRARPDQCIGRERSQGFTRQRASLRVGYLISKGTVRSAA